MRFVKWTSFIDQVTPSAKGSPAAVQVQAIKAATIRLCQEARVWSHVSDTADLIAGEQKYAFVFPDMEAQVVGVKSFRIHGAELRPTSQSDWPYGDTRTGRPTYWREEEPGFVVLWPIPDKDDLGAMIVHVDLAPTLDSKTVPAFILEHYREAIKYGALAELVNTQDSAWANPALALNDFEGKFKREVARARILEHMGGSADKTLSVRPLPYYYSSRNRYR